MKIDDVKVGDEYAINGNWVSARQRLRAEEVVRVPVTTRSGDRYFRSTKTTLRRQVRCTVLDWKTGEPTGKELTTPARDMEPFAHVTARIAAKASREERALLNKERAVAAFDRLGVPVASIYPKSYGGVEVVLTEAGIEALAKAALL